MQRILNIQFYCIFIWNKTHKNNKLSVLRDSLDYHNLKNYKMLSKIEDQQKKGVVSKRWKRQDVEFVEGIFSGTISSQLLAVEIKTMNKLLNILKITNDKILIDINF